MIGLVVVFRGDEEWHHAWLSCVLPLWPRPTMIVSARRERTDGLFLVAAPNARKRICSYAPVMAQSSLCTCVLVCRCVRVLVCLCVRVLVCICACAFVCLVFVCLCPCALVCLWARSCVCGSGCLVCLFVCVCVFVGSFVCVSVCSCFRVFFCV